MNHDHPKRPLLLLLFAIFCLNSGANASLYSSQFSSIDTNSKVPASNKFFGIIRVEGMNYFTALPGEEKLNQQQLSFLAAITRN